jgi:hypothetical protein
LRLRHTGLRNAFLRFDYSDGELAEGTNGLLGGLKPLLETLGMKNVAAVAVEFADVVFHSILL